MTNYPALSDTVNAMLSNDWKQRLRAEYWQTKIRLEKLHATNIKNETQVRLLDRGYPHNVCYYSEETKKSVENSVLGDILRQQEEFMTGYLKFIEMRAELCSIDLNPELLKGDE